MPKTRSIVARDLRVGDRRMMDTPMVEHLVADDDSANPHGGDCVGTRCPSCGCCMHCITDDKCGCALTGPCPDRDCQCDSVQRKPL